MELLLGLCVLELGLLDRSRALLRSNSVDLFLERSFVGELLLLFNSSRS